MEKTTFKDIYNCFYRKITDDMYMELSETETAAMTEELFIDAINHFEFPRVNIYDYDIEKKEYNIKLSIEEINIIATYMVVAWLNQQVASVELTRMKYSGSDFKFTSQANHLSKLLALKKDFEQQGFHLQRLYKRRKANSNGIMKSTMGQLRGDKSKVIVDDDICDTEGLNWEVYGDN